MPHLSLRDVLKATHGSVVGPTEELTFQRVSTDSRQPADGSLFVALSGPSHDGHAYLAAAAAQGARAALVDRVQPPESVPLVQVRVDDTRVALARLAVDHARRCAARRVAVTGSNGKTTTKALLRAALSAGGATVASEKSFNNDIGVPLSLLRIEEETRFAILELGTNAPGEIATLAGWVRPDVGVITNCSEAHLERLGDLDGVVQEKGALLDALPEDGVAILNADDASFEALRERAPCRVVSFGIRCAADVRATGVKVDFDRASFHVGDERVLVPLGGCHNVSNALAALAAAEALGVPRTEAARALRSTEAPPARLRPVARGDVLVLDDSYNANPGSVEAAMRTLAAAHPGRRKVAFLGDMKELGAHAAALHERVGRLASLLGDGMLIAVGQHAEATAKGARDAGLSADRVRTRADADEAAADAVDLVRAGDVVLVKGSRLMAMERVVAAVESARVASAG